MKFTSINNFHSISYDLGDGNTTTISGKRVQLRRWYTLRVVRHNKNTEVFLNTRRVARAVSPGLKTIANFHTVMYVGMAGELLGPGKK